MTVTLRVPYHRDEYRPDLDFPRAADQNLTAGLPPGDSRARLAVLVGARDLDPPELAYLDNALISRADVAELNAAGLPDGPLYVHPDLDVIDPDAVPGLRYPGPRRPAALAAG